MNDNERINELVNLCRTVYNKGMVCGSGGNISFRSGENIYITPSGYSLGRITCEDIVKVSMNGKVCGKLRPSKELALHLGAYKIRSEIKAVLHVHSYYTVLAGILVKDNDIPMPSYSPGYVIKIGDPAIVPFNIPGSEKLAQSIENKLMSSDVILMKNHGITIVGTNLMNLFDKAEEVENNARLHVSLAGVGALDSNSIKEIKERYR